MLPFWSAVVLSLLMAVEGKKHDSLGLSENIISSKDALSSEGKKKLELVYRDLSELALEYMKERKTLCKYPESMLGKMFATNVSATSSSDYHWTSLKDEGGAYLIDRSPRYFEPVLDYLRHGKVVANHDVDLKGVIEEAKFFNLQELIDLTTEEIDKRQNPPNSESPFSRKDICRILAGTPFTTNQQLRFQGIDFTDADLSFLDLRNVNFRHANMTRADLTGCTLSESNMEWANLTDAILDGAQLLSVKLTRANLEGASLINCNFEDPHQQRAVLEGANLKGANLEGSQMAWVNLRVASLKNAKLKNCDLRCAVLAGADLENCDLSGSDLHEANLRGANFINATFEDMMTPLHMSQTL